MDNIQWRKVQRGQFGKHFPALSWEQEPWAANVALVAVPSREYGQQWWAGLVTLATKVPLTTWFWIHVLQVTFSSSFQSTDSNVWSCKQVTIFTICWHSDYTLVSHAEESTRKECPHQETGRSGFISHFVFQYNLIYWHMGVLYISLFEILRNRFTQFWQIGFLKLIWRWWPSMAFTANLGDQTITPNLL